MTPAEQFKTLGICVEPEDGDVLIQMDRSFMLFSLEEIAKFDHYLHLAATAAQRQRQRRRIVGER